jgi:hopene-associated glycosyltransferase HpnB
MSTLAFLALLAWIYLAALHGRFWQSGPILPQATPLALPAIAIVVPARNEAHSIAESIGSLLAQDYAGAFRVILVDDNSTDDTAEIARAVPGAKRLQIVTGAARPPGWAGKLWAVHQGVAQTSEELLLLTDADIVHDPAHLSSMVAKLLISRVDMVSEMVQLRCQSIAERMLIPAFVYFFAMLYPFAWVNNGQRATAAAAGGSILIRRTALNRIGGIASMSSALIDDVTLAARVKRGGRIWLGHATLARSIRPYPEPRDIWRMIARSAYTQLKLSPSLLVLSILGMALLFIVPPVSAAMGVSMGGFAWTIMAVTFWPTLKRMKQSPFWAPFLPFIAVFYMAATLGSAWDHHFGGGVVWKDRAYSEPRA